MRIAITGASGNVGTALLRRLAEEADVDVVAIARRPPQEQAQFGPRVQWAAADIATDDLERAFAGADVVVHQAWLIQPSRVPQEMARVNLRGTQRVIDATVAAGAGALVHASSVGAYSPGPKRPPVEESHPTTGVPSSTYSVHKARAERMLDQAEVVHPQLRVARVRPGVVLQRGAASAIARYFLGGLLPVSLVRPGLVPVVPRVPGLAVQAVHADDLADAYARIALGDARGAFNVAGEPVLDPATIARILRAKTVLVPRPLLRGVADVTYRLHLQASDAGWFDLGTRLPLMDTARARRELGWVPKRDTGDALLEVLEGMRSGTEGGTPVLRPHASVFGQVLARARSVLPGTAPSRVEEIATEQTHAASR